MTWRVTGQPRRATLYLRIMFVDSALTSKTMVHRHTIAWERRSICKLQKQSLCAWATRVQFGERCFNQGACLFWRVVRSWQSPLFLSGL